MPVLTLDDYKKHDQEYSREDINAEVVLISEHSGEKIYTLLLTIPNIIHPELLRHRSFSFCVSSNRAVPNEKMIKDAGFLPKVWRSVGKGMQPKNIVTDSTTKRLANIYWKEARAHAIAQSQKLNDIEIAKELTNRLLGPFQIINILIGTTQSGLDHFLKLRNAPEAQFEIQVLARRIEEAIRDHPVQHLKSGEWHLPFVLEEEKEQELYKQLMVSTARCARTSYRLPGTNKISTFEDDLRLCKKLVDPNAIHASPFEFCATPLMVYRMPKIRNFKYLCEGNYNKWAQLRYFVETEDYSFLSEEQEVVIEQIRYELGFI